MHVSLAGTKFIAAFEGFRSCPYGPPHDVWTIGFGHTEGVSGHTKCVSKAAAYRLLQHDLAVKYERPLYFWAQHLGLNQHQFDALVSIVYNCGAGILARGRTMGDALRSGSKARIANAFLVYDMPGTIFHEGLRRRRVAERALFLRPVAKPLTHNQKLVVAWTKRLDALRVEARHRKAKHLAAWTPATRKLAAELKADIARHH
jgi:lysozyme